MNIMNETFKYSIKKDFDLEKYNKKIQCNETTECSVCLVSYPEHTTFYLMKCNHSFCIECCEKWYSIKNQTNLELAVANSNRTAKSKN